MAIFHSQFHHQQLSQKQGITPLIALYDREYTSNTLTINFDVNEHAPLILYPTENIKNILPQLTFRGISPI